MDLLDDGILSDAPGDFPFPEVPSLSWKDYTQAWADRLASFGKQEDPKDQGPQNQGSGPGRDPLPADGTQRARGREAHLRLLRSQNREGAPETEPVPDEDSEEDRKAQASRRRTKEAAPQAGPLENVPRSPRGGQLLDLNHILEQRPPGWLVEGMIPRGGLGFLYGSPGVGKTFLAVDLLVAASAGRKWLGKMVRPGPSVYVVAEGTGGFRDRIKAAARKRILEADPRLHKNLRAWGSAVQFLDNGSFQRFLAEILEMTRKPKLIIVDTLARCTAGGDENSSRDMGLFIQRCDELRERTGAAVLVLHHSGKKGSTERGSSCLRGAADTMMSLSGTPQRLCLTCDKQKDAPPFNKVYFRLKPVPVGKTEAGEVVRSCRVKLFSNGNRGKPDGRENEPGSGPVGKGSRRSPSLAENDPVAKAILDFLRASPSGITLKRLAGRFGQKYKGPKDSRSTFYRRVTALKEANEIVTSKKGRDTIAKLNAETKKTRLGSP